MVILISQVGFTSKKILLKELIRLLQKIFTVPADHQNKIYCIYLLIL